MSSVVYDIKPLITQVDWGCTSIVEHLPGICKPWFDSQHWERKMPGVVAHTCNSSTVEGKAV